MIAPPFIFMALLLGALTLGCVENTATSSSAPQPVEPDSTVLPYRLDQPDAAFALPVELVEISGLTALDSTHLAAVQDEEGIIFVLDRETAHITAQGRFRGSGDYEGIEVVDGLVWMLRSDGVLYSTNTAVSHEMESTRHDMDLHANCDAEGLAFDAPANRLLIVCKEHPGRGLRGRRAIYAFDLAAERRIEAAVYLIDREGLDSPGQRFKPSALAIHPSSGYLYVLSSVRKVLVLLDPADSGHILEAHTLPEHLFPQPEGLAFFPDGTLFIANEGVNGPATLLRFDEQSASQ